MILLADESVDRPIVERLRQDGHDTTYVAELAPSITDDEVLREANARSALLLTEDKDFGELFTGSAEFMQGLRLSAWRACQPLRKPTRLRKCCKTMVRNCRLRLR